MDSLVGYGSDDEVETERCGRYRSSVDHGGASAPSRRRDDDTNYDDVNMDMSEEAHVLPQDSQGGDSEPELPQAEPAPPKRDEKTRNDKKNTESRDRERESRRGGRGSAPRDKERSRRSPRRDDRHRSDKSDRRGSDSKRGLLGDKPDDKNTDSKAVPALMDLKPFGGEPPPGFDRRSQDARDATSPRFTERDRRDRDKERERDRDHRHSRRSEEKRHKPERSERSRSRGNYPPPHAASSSGSSTDRSSASNEYRPSYKVNKKLEVMEKMGLQIKTPDGSMATASQLRAAAGDPQPRTALPSYYNPGALAGGKVLDQVAKRKLLWSHKNKSEQEEAGKWSGTRFAQDSDGKQVNKFMRLMGIKDPAAIKAETDKEADPIKKQEELFQAMQAQYEVARATTHTMRGVGLGFQRGQF